MNAATERTTVAGPAGGLECTVDRPAPGVANNGRLALLCHPHPLHGGTMDNKVVQTLARAVVQLGYTAVRFNFRGVGASQGRWDEGRGEIDDAQAVLTALRQPPQAVLLGGFSFGGFVATHLAARLAEQGPAQAAQDLVLVSPAVVSFVAAPVPPHTLVVQGEADDVVPMQAVLDWARPQNLPVTVLPGAGHFFHGQLLVLKQIVLNAVAGRSAMATGTPQA
jgi:uncharacterized protein